MIGTDTWVGGKGNPTTICKFFFFKFGNLAFRWSWEEGRGDECPAHCMFACWWLIALMGADRHTDRKMTRLTDRQTGRETYRQTDGRSDIQKVPFLEPKLVCSTNDWPVLLQLDKFCLK